MKPGHKLRLRTVRQNWNRKLKDTTMTRIPPCGVLHHLNGDVVLWDQFFFRPDKRVSTTFFSYPVKASLDCWFMDQVIE